MSFITIIFLIIIGLLAGILSGVVGVGRAIVIIPGLSQQEAQGTSLAVMLPPIGILAAVNYYKAGFVKWEYAIIIALTFLELLMCFYALFGIYSAFSLKDFGLLPFHCMLALGFGYVAFFSYKHSTR